MTRSLGVIVGRFQTPILTEGHRILIEHVTLHNTNVVVFIGSAQERSTEKNPLSYKARERMIRHAYPDVFIKPLIDYNNASAWSMQLDDMIDNEQEDDRNSGGKGWDVVTLYGGRDSFIDSYVGIYPTEIFADVPSFSGTEMRASCVRDLKFDDDGCCHACAEFFRRGVIHSTQNPSETLPINEEAITELAIEIAYVAKEAIIHAAPEEEVVTDIEAVLRKSMRNV